jgi:hypothetical protein
LVGIGLSGSAMGGAGESAFPERRHLQSVERQPLYGRGGAVSRRHRCRRGRASGGSSRTCRGPSPSAPVALSLRRRRCRDCHVVEISDPRRGTHRPARLSALDLASFALGEARRERHDIRTCRRPPSPAVLSRAPAARRREFDLVRRKPDPCR